VLASTTNLLKINGWRAGAPFGEGTANFEVMREWDRSVVYGKPWFSLPSGLRAPEAHPGSKQAPLWCLRRGPVKKLSERASRKSGQLVLRKLGATLGNGQS
jgi:hypothetical protein